MDKEKSSSGEIKKDEKQSKKLSSKVSLEEKKEKKDIPEIKPGMLIRVHERIKELNAKGESKERVQIFEGMVLSHHRGCEPGATITVRKIAVGNIGVEKIYPIYSPDVLKIEIVKKYKVKRAKLYYLRDYKKKLKEIK